MRKWWSIWNGHVLAGIAALLAATTIFLMWLALRADEPSTIFWFGMAAIVSGVLTMCMLGVAAFHWKDHRERYGIRHGLIGGRRQTPAGGHR
jgi:hypothetical protein